MTSVDIAQAYLSANLSVVPIATNGSKRPLVRWKEYQTCQPTKDEIRTWWARPANIAVIAGNVSGNLEVIDIDAPELAATFGASEPELLARLPLARTPSGGYHVYYRCPEIGRNAILARNAERETLIETRGEGGMATVPPSTGYQMLRGSLTRIPTISPGERQALHDAASLLNQYEPPQPQQIYTTPTTPTGDRPGDLFNATANWYEILSKHGWRLMRTRHDGAQEWRRPDKDGDGISATVGANGHDVLYVFSSNAYPFEPHCGYTKFTAYALLEHHGDVSIAAKWLAATERTAHRIAI